MAGFEREADARRFQEALRQRLEKFGLELHPQKTRLVEFGRFAASNRQPRGLGKPETFAFLGFVFVCGRSRREPSSSTARVAATGWERSCRM